MTVQAQERNDETSPLLGDVEQMRSEVPSLRKPTPLPLRQLFVLALVRMCEPLAFTSIFAFVNEMVEDLNVTDDPSQVGFYSGLIDSCFAIAQITTAFYWGSLSDRVGRKPVLFIGLSGAATSIFLFGLSKSLVWALVSRSIAGALSSNIAVILSILGEITDKTNETRALPMVDMTWSIGSIVGPLIGGAFSKPAIRYPDIFGNVAFLHEYPYVLPCTIAASVVLFSISNLWLFLEETLPSKVRPATSIAPPSTSPVFNAVPGLKVPSSLRTPVKHSVRDLLAIDALRRICFCSFLLNTLNTCCDVVFILMSYTPIHLGGLSRTPLQIGTGLAGGGIFTLIILPLGLPPLQAHYGTKRLYQALMMIWPVIFMTLPFLNLTARLLSDGEDKLTSVGQVVTWIGIMSIICAGRIGCLCFSLNVLLLKHAAPNKGALGSVYGLSQTVGCAARAISPAFVSSLFAVSIGRQLLGGQLVWLIMTLIGFVGVFAARQLKENTEKDDSTPNESGPGNNPSLS